MSGHDLKLVKTSNTSAPHRPGYANQTLYLNLTSLDIAVRPVTRQMKDLFIGGKGFDLWLLWNAVTPRPAGTTPKTRYASPAAPWGEPPPTRIRQEHRRHPLAVDRCGHRLQRGRLFRPYLKFSGFDALEIQGGRAGYRRILDGIDQTVQIFTATGLPEDAYKLSELLTSTLPRQARNISVVSAGPGAQNTISAP